MEEIELENGGYKRIFYFRLTKIKSSEYYMNKFGSYHREGDVPAVIRYCDNGSVESEDYYVNGEDVTEETEIRLKRLKILKHM